MPVRPSQDVKEQKIQWACEQLLQQKQNGQKPNIKQTARDKGLSYSTLYARFSFNNIHKSPRDAREAHQYLSPSVEHVLVK